MSVVLDMWKLRNRRADTAEKRALAHLEPDEVEKLHQPFASSPRSALPPPARFGPAVSYAVIIVFTFGTAADHGYIHPVLLKFVGAAGCLALGFRLLVFRRWADENRYVLRFLACLLSLIVELLFENFMVWVVSQTDARKLEFTPPLQDNIELAVLALENGRAGAWVKPFTRFRWANVLHFLAALLALAFGNVYDQVPYSGFGLMARVTLTLCLSRLIRVACFMSTVLPSPRPGCFIRRFKKVANTWPEFWRMGMGAMRGSGGCNDLIFSGHCGFWVMAPLAFQTYYPKPLLTGLLWFILVHTSIRDVLEYQHYSVDMILAVVCTWPVWNALAWVYPEGSPLPKRPPGAPSDKINPLVLGVVVLVVLAAAVLLVLSGA